MCFSHKDYLGGPSKCNNDRQSIFFATHFNNCCYQLCLTYCTCYSCRYTGDNYLAFYLLSYGCFCHFAIFHLVHLFTHSSQRKYTTRDGRDCCDDMFFDKRVKMATSHLIQSRICKINAPNKFTAYMISWKFPKSQSLTTLVISGLSVGLVLLMCRVGLWTSLAICVSIWDR